MRRWWLVSCVAVVWAVFLVVAFSFGQMMNGLSGGDFRVFYDAANRLQAGEAVYARDPSPFDNLPYVNPPFFALAIVPFTWLDYPLARGIWTAIVYLLTVVACFVLLGRGEATPRRRFWLWATLLSVPVYLATIFYAQNSALVLFGLALCYWLEKRGHGTLAGVALTFGLVKPQLLLGPVIALVVTGRWRVIGGFASAAAVLGVISVWLIGVEGILTYVTVNGDAGRLIALEPRYRWDMHTPYAILSALWSEEAYVGSLVVALVAVGLMAWRLRRGPREIGLALSVGVVGTFMIAPYAHVYDLMILAVPWLLEGQRLRRFGVLVLGGSYIGPLVHLLVMGTGGFGPIVTVTMLVLLFGVLVVAPLLPERGLLRASEMGRYGFVRRV